MFNQMRADRIIGQIKQSKYWNDSATENEKYLNGLKCPVCDRAEAYLFKERPDYIHCNRKNKCGTKVKVTDILPNPIDAVEKDYPPTEDDPRAPATAYLKYRGLEKSLEGLEYEYRSNIRGTGSGGVLFPIHLPDGNVAYNGRIFNPPAGTGKSHNEGEVGKGFWMHTGLQYSKEKPTYVVEGVNTALALIEIGLQAIATLSANKGPGDVEMNEFGEIILAFDNDKAGRQATGRWSDYFQEKNGVAPKAILPDAGGDWNDFLLSIYAENALSVFEEKMPSFEANAELARAKSPNVYAEILYSMKQIHGLFEFGGCYWYSTLSGKTVSAVEVSDFTLRTVRFELDLSNNSRPVFTYHLEVQSEGRVVSFIVSAQELSTANQLKTIFMECARVLWKGDNAASTSLLKLILKTKAPEVHKHHITGYDLETRCYIFKTHMIDPYGNLIWTDKFGLLKVSDHQYILPPPHNTIRPSVDSNVLRIIALAISAWGDRAAVAIAWTVGTWFVNQIKEIIGFFPFLSFYLDSQTGKSNLTKFLNALQCMDEEGIPMLRTNTAKGELRKLGQRSGLFVALSEWPRDAKQVRFDLNHILTLFNINPLQIRAMKTNDVQTTEMAFLGALLFVQNIEPFITKPQKERVISLEFRAEQLNDETRMAYNELDRVPITDKAAFFPFIMSHRQWIEANWFDFYKSAQNELSGLNLSSRIVETHGLVLGFNNIVSHILKNHYDLVPYLSETAVKKQKDCLEYEETYADFFFENLLNCEADQLKECSRVEALNTYVNIPGAEKIIKANGYSANWKTSDLHDCLRNHPAFIERKEQPVRIDGKTKKVWVFDSNKLSGSSEIEG